MVHCYTYVIAKGSPFFEEGTILVTSKPVESPFFQLKGHKDVTKSFFPLFGVFDLSVREFQSWKELWNEFEADDLKAEFEMRPRWHQRKQNNKAQS
jgi:hypothetical protein